jgi:DUF971 family protein
VPEANIFKIENIAIVMDELAVVFSDEVEIYLPLPLLRRACPCASCQGEPDAMGRVVKPRLHHSDKSFILSKIEHVGSYAIQLYWLDGHSTGIYSLLYLRKLATIL